MSDGKCKLQLIKSSSSMMFLFVSVPTKLLSFDVVEGTQLLRDEKFGATVNIPKTAT